MHTPGIARPARVGRAAARWWRTWWPIVHLGAMLAVLAASPSSWGRAGRYRMAARLWHSAAPQVLGFGVLSALISLVIMRIVLVTAQSYGLSQVALEMVVRVLVLELIPLTAALFVALRVSIPAAIELAAWRAARSADRGGRPRWLDGLRLEVLPRALASAFTVLLLALLSGVVCLVLAYLLAHGFSPWGFERYTRLVGQIFSPTVSLIFAFKTASMAMAVAVIPLGSALLDPHEAPLATSVELQGLVRLLMALLLIEMLSLVGNYY